ncbi:MAG: hypothetical protein Q9166_002477 [cf. Caloplaca sp. 2 TL-2023]
MSFQEMQGQAKHTGKSSIAKGQQFKAVKYDMTQILILVRYVQMLERQQTQLTAGLKALHHMMQNGEQLSGEPLHQSDQGRPSAHGILERLRVLEVEDPWDGVQAEPEEQRLNLQIPSSDLPSVLCQSIKIRLLGGLNSRRMGTQRSCMHLHENETYQQQTMKCFYHYHYDYFSIPEASKSKQPENNTATGAIYGAMP